MSTRRTALARLRQPGPAVQEQTVRDEPLVVRGRALTPVARRRWWARAWGGRDADRGVGLAYVRLTPIAVEDGTRTIAVRDVTAMALQAMAGLAVGLTLAALMAGWWVARQGGQGQ